MEPFEFVYVDAAEVACDGGGGPLGHPRVFLHIDAETGSVVCPYCSRTFISKQAAMKPRQGAA